MDYGLILYYNHKIGKEVTMKYKVIKDYPTSNGILYKNELVKEEGNSTLKGHIRVKDNMGRIWFIPKENLAKKS